MYNNSCVACKSTICARFMSTDNSQMMDAVDERRGKRRGPQTSSYINEQTVHECQ